MQKIIYSKRRTKKDFKSVEYFEFTKIIQGSNFIFSGPGSPSYASKNWIDTDVPEIFKEKLINGSSLVFASAAASTLGIRTIPVYEIYKVGIDPYWENGINLLEVFDIDCVVVPHFNNKEGGNHDTSISYLGQNRMKILQEINPTNILGIDEHTALIINGEEDSFEVEGLGEVTVINKNVTKKFKIGDKYNLDELKELLKNDASLEKVKNEPGLSLNEDAEDALKKEIADLRIEIDKNKKNLNFESGFKSNEPIFVLGLPRAGSTLLEQILASHSKIEGTQELGNIMTIGRRIRTSNNSEDYLNNLLNLDDKSIKSHGKSYLDETQWAREGKDFFIDKMPNNFPHIGLIKMILPNAKIIDARRNPMDGCFSCFKQYFAKGQHFTYDLDDIARYYKDYEKIMEFWNSYFPGSIHTVLYEDVIKDSENQVRKMIDFLDLDFEESCLSFYKSSRPVKTASSEQVRQPIYKSAMNYWKHFEGDLSELINHFPEYE